MYFNNNGTGYFRYYCVHSVLCVCDSQNLVSEFTTFLTFDHPPQHPRRSSHIKQLSNSTPPAVIYHFSSRPHCLPVIILEGLVPEQQVSEAEPWRQRRHLTLHLLHLKGGDV